MNRDYKAGLRPSIAEIAIPFILNVANCDRVERTVLVSAHAALLLHI